MGCFNGLWQTPFFNGRKEMDLTVSFFYTPISGVGRAPTFLLVTLGPLSKLGALEGCLVVEARILVDFLNTPKLGKVMKTS